MECVERLIEEIHSFEVNPEIVGRGVRHLSENDCKNIYSSKDSPDFFKGTPFGRLFETIIYEYLLDVVNSSNLFSHILEGGSRISKKVTADPNILGFHTANERTNIGCGRRELSEFDALIICPGRVILNIEVHKGKLYTKDFKIKWRRRHSVLQELFSKKQVVTVIISDKIEESRKMDDIQKHCSVKIGLFADGVKNALVDPSDIPPLPEKQKLLSLDKVRVTKIDYTKREKATLEAVKSVILFDGDYGKVEEEMKKNVMLGKLSLIATSKKELFDSFERMNLKCPEELSELSDGNKAMLVIDCEQVKPQIYLQIDPPKPVKFKRIDFKDGVPVIQKKKTFNHMAGAFFTEFIKSKITIDPKFIDKCLTVFIQFSG